MACNNPKCICTNCTYDLCKCAGTKECKCTPESGRSCCKSYCNN